MLVEKGTVYIAPGGLHMEVKQTLGKYILHLNENPPENSCRPSCDVLIRAVAEAGLADEILPLDMIENRIRALVIYVLTYERREDYSSSPLLRLQFIPRKKTYDLGIKIFRNRDHQGQSPVC